jgi:dihydrolipoamide dehydrogenase
MFRSMMPRATPRAALRTAGPQSVPSSFVAAPSLSVYGRFRRGYASETGK